jgi:hypothetical protein
MRRKTGEDIRDNRIMGTDVTTSKFMQQELILFVALQPKLYDDTQLDTHTHTHTPGRTPMNDRSARRRGHCLHNA